eukprot:CAMPEP_0197641952 /NCGR_PEP_ID=MMETSP1338-20131121/15748_1 /TAXON_ID=43686 ORGANISM="Pelagodinium beii, Strain RCC1491" /NCGR_SAMPLE_ID=MMETSP1338 /ASSEMBLY_ACC=CAM_ASM_000754 /LENGTH=3533 /DNA_ID=CAMNT_0043215005 /DNA_START=82 /DNA_END=10683 /DNA_ORIENTATION=-
MAEGRQPKQDLSLRTIAGPVDFRPARQVRTLTLTDNLGTKEVKKGWLKAAFTTDGLYQKAVKQAMMIGAEEVRLRDASDPSWARGTEVPEQIEAKIQSLAAGTQRIVVSDTKKKNLSNVKTSRDPRVRETLIKISRRRPCGGSFAQVERSFVIDNGELLVYRDHNANAKIKAQYLLKNATCFYETPATSSLPTWKAGFSERLRVLCQEREAQSKSPLFLYATDPAKIHRWKRAFTLAKVLIAENDRRALKVSIGRATSGSLIKAWDALTMYYGEYSKTRALVKNMAMRLMKVDISRGWMKFKLVYRKREDETRRRKEQQLWAARFMSEKLTKLGKQNAKELADVREGIITRIQSRFRSYREDMIFDRMYPLGPQMMSRVQQAKLGKVMDVSLQTVSVDEACMLNMTPAVFEKFQRDRDSFRTVLPSYSAIENGFSPVQAALVYAADNLQSLSFAEASGDAEMGFSAISKTDWSKFINHDRVSSVILHSEPALGATLANANKPRDAGVWLTINGPRAAWDKRVTKPKDVVKFPPATVGGSEDALEVGSAIALKRNVHWVTMKAQLGSAKLPAQSVLTQDLDPTADVNSVPEYKTFAVVHLLGWSFKSDPQIGASVDYNFSCQAEVPVASDKFVSLDNSEVAVEIYYLLPDVIKEDKTVFPGGQKLLVVGCEKIANIFKTEAGEDGKTKLAEKLVSSGKIATKLRLYHPGAMAVLKDDETRRQADTGPKVEIDLELTANFTAKSEYPPNKGPICVSPELVGGGVNNTLFSAHRGVWYDPQLGGGRFRADHAATFLELSLQTLRFAVDDKADDKDESLYYVRVKSAGVGVTSTALHRPKTSWTQVLSPIFMDADSIRFEGEKLLIPLPPGCWGPEAVSAARRILDIEVFRMDAKQNPKLMKYEAIETMLKGGQKPAERASVASAEKVLYQGQIKYDHRMLVDMSKQLSVYLFSSNSKDASNQEKREPVDAYAAVNTDGAAVGQAMLSMDFCLRDRDHARALAGAPGQRSALCVGDKVMLLAEEPFLYPKDATDFRKQFCVGEFNTKKAWSGDAGMPLREPCTSAEYSESGLGDLVPKRPFKQSFIPQFCEGIIPCKFVLPLSEKEHRDKHLPGYFWRIMDQLVKEAKSARKSEFPYRSGNNKPVVNNLSHRAAHVPAVILATYADYTCDIEISKDFLTTWQQNAYKQYGLPGTPDIEPPPKGASADVPPRVLLLNVPMIYLSATQYTGFNIYDAAFKSTSDVKKAPAPQNDFDPRSDEVFKVGAKKDATKYSTPAGPLPPDASPSACLYEFSIRVRFPNEFDMYQFVAMLRRCVRLDHFQQASKMLEYQQKKGNSAPQIKQYGPKTGGQLEVVLVEARRLKPFQSAVNNVLQSDPISLYEQWTKKVEREPDLGASNQVIDANYLPELLGTTGGESVKCTPEGNTTISTFVNFRMLHNKEEIPVKGKKVQISPVIPGTDSPNWSKQDALVPFGGCIFRSGNIDPEKYPKLLIEFEVMQAGIPSATRIGVIQLPVTEEQFLTNPNKLFKNLWLPLVSIDKEGNLTPNVTGEIHIMTRWLPAEMRQVMADGQEKLQISVRSMFMKEIWTKVCQPRIREPIYGIEAVYHQYMYNPNMVRTKPGEESTTKVAEPFKDNMRRHIEELHHNVPYLECLERRQLNAWKAFEAELQQKKSSKPDALLAELRIEWQAQEDLKMVDKLKQMVLRGVPSSYRPRVWAELTLSKRVATHAGSGATGSYDMGLTATDAERAAEEEYKTLLQRGLLLQSDAFHQLQEDALNMAEWETAQPVPPDVMSLHLQRIRRAQNVVIALLAFEDGGVVYCESLLVLAFFLLLPQGYKDVSSAALINDSLVNPTEPDVFWLLYTLICTKMNGVFRGYYGLPFSGEFGNTMALVDGSGGPMEDVLLLECCLVYYDKDLWMRLQAVGFQLATVFYGAFMRWYATYMPTASVFRFWDALLMQTTDPDAQPTGKAYLINLAFATLRCKKNELMLAESAFEMKSILLGFMGSLYDTSTVIDMVTAADKYLWGGAGYSSGKVAHLWTMRDDLFKGVNNITRSQNEILKKLCHEGQMRVRRGDVGSTAATAQDGMVGISTARLIKEVLPTIQVNIEQGRGMSGNRQFWAMHRPMPLAAKTVSETTVEKAWGFFSTNFLVQQPPLPLIPMMVSPAKLAEKSGLEPEVKNTDLVTIFERDFQGWGQNATALWNVFCNRKRNFMGAAAGYGGSLGMSNDPSNYGTGNIAGEVGQGFLAGAYSNATGGANNNSTLSNFGASDYGASTSGNNASAGTLAGLGGYQQTSAFQRTVAGWFGQIGVKKEVDSNAPNYQSIDEPGSAGGLNDEDISRISLNELYSALICASRGTLAEKAAALFNIYAYPDSLGDGMYHITPVSKVAKSASAYAVEEAAEVSRMLAPSDPTSDDAKINNVLKFTVMTDYNSPGEVLGDVLIPTLSPYISRGTSAPQPKNFNIWARPKKLTDTFGNQQDQDKFICTGEINMSIQWTTHMTSAKQTTANTGQLTVWVRHVKFFDLYHTDQDSFNPYIKMTYSAMAGSGAGQARKWLDVPRWDPRGLYGQGDTKSLTSTGAYGGKIHWDPPLKKKTAVFGGGRNQFTTYTRNGENQGWDKDRGWYWNDTWGKQSTKQDFEVGVNFVARASRRNVMDMQGVRILVGNLLQRCMLNCTNRQTTLIADSFFNRAGVVPGILSAYIFKGDVPGKDKTGASRSFLQIKDEYDKAKRQSEYVDVTHPIVLEHERQMCVNGGIVNLFAESYMINPIHLDAMNITDPFTRQAKTLVIRFVRGSDGERVTQFVPISPDGKIDKGEKSEVILDAQDAEPMSKVSKEEFIACFINSPILGESLRRLSHIDHKLAVPSKAIDLEVTISDPAEDNPFKDLEETMNIQQSLCIEVWDSDMLSMDFLGEAWLPPLSEFSAQPKDLVLQLQPANFSKEAENGQSRADDRKNIKDDGKDPNLKISGQIFVTVSWVYPAIEGRGVEVELSLWLQDLEKKNKITHKLMPYMAYIEREYGTVKNIAAKEVNDKGVLQQKFFDTCQISKQHKDIFTKWFKEQTSSDMAGRAKQQELKHTGTLTVKILRAERLRRSDAKKFRDCDPRAYVYVRNDVRGAWKKKPLFQTAQIRNNRDPVWNFEESKPLLQGNFEAQFRQPTEGWGAASEILSKSLNTRSARHKEEDRQLNAVKRFGANGLKCSFLSEDKLQAIAQSSSSELPEGSNHEVKIYLTDTIREFKGKLTAALHDESQHWKSSKGADSDQYFKYEGIEIGASHLVMAYVPSAKVSKMVQTGNTKSAEYERESKRASLDPSNWQPLDVEKSFKQYVSSFGFGRQRQMLKVVKATASYKAVNLAYKHWLEERNKPKLKDVNTTTECFGWAKYVHKGDKPKADESGTEEWRPATISKAPPDSKPPEGSEEKNFFNVKWLQKPDSTDQKRAREELLPRSQVLLNPRIAKIDATTSLEEHLAVLKQAKSMRASGKSDWEIEVQLNKLMFAKWEADNLTKDIKDAKPPPITVDQIRGYLQELDDKASDKVFK